MALILLVEDEKLLRWSLEKRLSEGGHTVHCAANCTEASDHLARHSPDVLLLDLVLPDCHGLDFYQQNTERLEEAVVIVMTAAGHVEDAVRAMKLGALDFLNKPVDHTELIALIDRSLSLRRQQLEAQAARRSRERELSMDVVAESPVFKRVLQVAEEVARSELTTVLIQGETGTGKNIVGRYIHALSPRRKRPLLEVSCAAIPDNLLESELFGHEKGAFTDAKERKRGTLELAEGGTVILDEVGEMKLELQSKLLHFLEERSFRRVGGVREIQVDVRVLALTNRDLPALVKDSLFRDDLYYRLNVFPITVPPLRDRPEDILPLAHHFVDSLQNKIGRRYSGFTREAENSLLTYPWPGNVRELRSAIERTMILEHGELITPGSLMLDYPEGAMAAGIVEGSGVVSERKPVESAESGARGAGAPSSTLPEGITTLAEVEREMVSRALRASGNNQTRAAELLGVTRDQLRYRVKKYGL